MYVVFANVVGLAIPSDGRNQRKSNGKYDCHPDTNPTEMTIYEHIPPNHTFQRLRSVHKCIHIHMYTIFCGNLIFPSGLKILGNGKMRFGTFLYDFHCFFCASFPGITANDERIMCEFATKIGFFFVRLLPSFHAICCRHGAPSTDIPNSSTTNHQSMRSVLMDMDDSFAMCRALYAQYPNMKQRMPVRRKR